MVLHAHPTISSNLVQEQVFESNTGILHSSPSETLSLTLQYCITTRSILPTFTQYFQEAGYDILYFKPFSSEASWTRLYPNHSIANTFSVQRTDTDPPTFPSLALYMSTSPTPVTPPIHNSPSNPTANPTTALISLMQQTLQQNATIMAHMHSRIYPPSALHPPPYQPYKPQRPPFKK